VIAYRDGELLADGVALAAVASAIGTPFYAYADSLILRNWQSLASAMQELAPTICFAVKANSSQAILNRLAGLGAGADIVSIGEFDRAVRAGIRPADMVFSGVGKRQDELWRSLEAGIGQINVESEAELYEIDRIAQALQCRAPVLLRVNPDVDAGTHAKITTGRQDSKFGIPRAAIPALYAKAAALPGIQLRGQAMHIGSQITQPAPFVIAYRILAAVVDELRGLGLAVDVLDLGGGLGVDYASFDPPDFVGWAQAIRSVIAPLRCQVMLEPGRALIAQAGLLVTRVIVTKPAADGWFVIVDAAMNDLMRPALYDAWHDIVPVRQAGAQIQTCHVVGPARSARAAMSLVVPATCRCRKPAICWP
jgi:diaminopimelate decarboxylase